jgi:hypothetical protein
MSITAEAFGAARCMATPEVEAVPKQDVLGQPRVIKVKWRLLARQAIPRFSARRVA